ncbi:MAG: hypothetical protein A2636_02845 [Elusimicrobia bacterium RIFCSPHIGHO2_01_FULL_64_10]|nr:MAG: hypothetical protein A2636_02845 [Elusimicrobia bacterium RIFCSPHIGHO2_01_FULL_64_10]
MISLTNMTQTAVTQSLYRLAKQGMLVRIKRGVWVNKLMDNINPFEAVPYLTAPWPAYMSLHSALADYGIIAEIPHIIYAVSTHIPRNVSTPIGTFHIHHLNKRLIWGYEVKQLSSGSYPIADPEKAFLDLAYLSLVPRSPIQMVHKRSKKWELNPGKLKEYAKRFEYPPLTRYLEKTGLL